MKEKPICHKYADRIPDSDTSACDGLACRRIHECMRYIQDHPTGIAGIKELTWRFSISSTLLRDRFKAEFGISLGAFLRRMRLEEARRMIEEEPDKSATRTTAASHRPSRSSSDSDLRSTGDSWHAA